VVRPKVFQQDRRGVRPERLAAQAHVQQPVFGGFRLGLGAVDQPALVWGTLDVKLDPKGRRVIQAHQLYAVELQVIDDRGELGLHVVPEHDQLFLEQSIESDGNS
jgi:hypothetical protein